MSDPDNGKSRALRSGANPSAKLLQDSPWDRIRGRRLQGAQSRTVKKTMTETKRHPARTVNPTVQPTIRANRRYGVLDRRPRSGPRWLGELSPMPENLTTWKIRGWTMAPGTRVGQGEAEILTTEKLAPADAAPRLFVEHGRSRPLGQCA